MRGVRWDMGQTLRLLLTFFILLAGVVAAQSAPALERGTAISDPAVLRELDSARFGIGRVLLPARSSIVPLPNSQLFALPSMAPVRKALDEEFQRYIDRHRTSQPSETIGVGNTFDLQLFDSTLLYSSSSRFVLAGIVNRMDRVHLAQSYCGEIRLIYRLIQTPAADVTSSPRLPMTLNIVLRAKGDQKGDSGATMTCGEIAGRWLAAGDLPLTGAALAEKLVANDGPLVLIRPPRSGRASAGH